MLTTPFGWTPNLEFYEEVADGWFVYVAWVKVLEDDGSCKNLFKIGTSRTPRLRSLNLGDSVDIIFAKKFERRAALCIEHKLHRMFRNKECKPPDGSYAIKEWFELSPEDLGLIQYGLQIKVFDHDTSTPLMRIARLTRSEGFGKKSEATVVPLDKLSSRSSSGGIFVIERSEDGGQTWKPLLSVGAKFNRSTAEDLVNKHLEQFPELRERAVEYVAKGTE
jgi:hypothetical protein